MSKVHELGARAFTIVRRTSRRTVYLYLLGFHATVATLLLWFVVAPTSARIRRCVDLRHQAQSQVTRTQELSDSLQSLRSRIEKLRRKVQADGPFSMSSGEVHTLARDHAVQVGLVLRRFVAQESEGEYLVTLEGGFNNVVMFGEVLRHDAASLRVRRLSARIHQSRDEAIELELLIKKYPYSIEVSPVCARLPQ